MDAKQFVKQMQTKLKSAGIENSNEIYFLLDEILGVSRADLVALDSFSYAQQKVINKAVNKRINGMSLQRIIGKSTFCGVTIKESRFTLTPRPETEYMTSLILKENKGRVLDLCAGSGAIGLALAKSGFDVTLADISVKAIKSINANAKLNELHVNIVKSNMFDKITGKFDIIVSNPPYIPTSECKTLSKDVLLNDPIIALDGGLDGLDFYRVIADKACIYLNDFGVLYLEIGLHQEESVQKLLEKHFKNITIIKDLNGINRIIRAEI